MGYRTGPKDEEAEALFDPSAGRDISHPTNYFESLMHYIKMNIGTGILALPYAYSKAGTILSPITTFIIAFIVAHSACMLVHCAQKFYYYSGRTSMNYSEVVDYAFTNGPDCGKKFAKFMSVAVAIGIFLTYFGICCVYAVVIGSTFQELVIYFFDITINLRLVILLLVFPLLLIVWIPNLKLLAPLSVVANCFMMAANFIMFYYFFTGEFASDHVKFDITQLPESISNIFFAMSTFGIILPLENNMKKPKQIRGFFGVLPVGTFFSAIVYCIFGLFGYLKYGAETKDAIVLNLPSDAVAGKIAQLLISMDILPSFALQLYVSLDIPWSRIKERVKYPLLVNYILRTLICCSAVAVAIVVPVIGPFMGVIGAFCMAGLGVVIPMLIHIAVSWEDGYGFCYWILWKDLLFLSVGLFAFFFGTVTSAITLVKNARRI